MALTSKRKAFCDAYLANGMNATQAALEAGYSPRTAKSQGSRLLTFVDVQEYIRERTEARVKERIASGDEVLAFLSDVMCGHEKETQVVVTECGVDTVGFISQRNQIKAAEVLAKCHGLTTQRIEHEGGLAVTFVDDLETEDGG